MTKTFEKINKGYNQVFRPDKLSLGVVVPIEQYASGPIPKMKNHLTRVQLVEELDFKSIWIRDVPLHVPSFGDAGQLFDPFTYLGFLAGQTSKITLGVASIALPLHHPLHVSKFANSVDQLSGGRLVLGVASGDRPDEYPSTGIDFHKRGELFRDSFDYIRKTQHNFPIHVSEHYGTLDGQSDLLPKATGKKIPMLITGYSQQDITWNAENGDGWMSYPKNFLHQEMTIGQWRELVLKKGEFDKPFMQPLYIDLQDQEDFPPENIHLGFKIGVKYLVDYLEKIRSIGVNHVALNLRFNQNPIEKTLEILAKKVLPHFHQ